MNVARMGNNANRCIYTQKQALRMCLLGRNLNFKANSSSRDSRGLTAVT